MNELQVIEKNGKRVLLTSQLAESYGTTVLQVLNLKSLRQPDKLTFCQI